MAIYHCSVKIVSRGKGQSVVAKASYNSREKLTNEKTGERHDFRNAGGVSFSGVFAPKNAPAWASDREKLWSEVEKCEKRKNSQLAREVEVALPHELTDQQREWLLKDFVRENFVRHGMVADVAIHDPSKEGDSRNYHAHILLTMREIGPEGFGEKMRHLNKKSQLGEWREKWEHIANRHLERHGYEVKIDRRTLEEQGIDREPTIHKGVYATKLEREGKFSERGEINDDIKEKNASRNKLSKEFSELNKSLYTYKKLEGLTDGFIDALDGFLDFFVGPTPKKRGNHHLQENVTLRARDSALDRWQRQLSRTNNDFSLLTPDELKRLSKEDLLRIKEGGPEAIRDILDERAKEKRREGGRERMRER